jgi:hypothetical protein
MPVLAWWLGLCGGRLEGMRKTWEGTIAAIFVVAMCAGNSGYWFGRVKRHAIFPVLRARAVEIGVAVGKEWDAKTLIAYCVQARAGSADERKAMELQRAERQLLFDWCWSDGR